MRNGKPVTRICTLKIECVDCDERYWCYSDEELKKMENEKSLNESCKHYDREEINVVIDGKTKPILKCKDCGKILNGEKK